MSHPGIVSPEIEIAVSDILRGAGVRLEVERSYAVLARLLLLAAEFGAGDALAGMVLHRVPEDVIRRAADALCIDGWTPTGGGACAAVSLLQGKSTNATITNLLRALDVAACAGRGVTLTDVSALAGRGSERPTP